MLVGVLLFRCLEHDEVKDESTEVDFGLLGKLGFGEKDRLESMPSSRRSCGS